MKWTLGKANGKEVVGIENHGRCCRAPATWHEPRQLGPLWSPSLTPVAALKITETWKRQQEGLHSRHALTNVS